ncbi:hypothetical protein ACE6H2_010317 [Prunus campanulata]
MELIWFGGSYLVWLERNLNSKGTHMRLTKCVHGVVKSVIVPQGLQNEGWILLKENLEAIMTGNEKRCLIEDVRYVPSVSSSASNKSYKEAVETRAAAEAKEKKEESQEENANWSWVVVCERQVVHQSWNDIRTALRGLLKKEVTLFPYQANRAFFPCDSKLEALKVSSIGTETVHVKIIPISSAVRPNVTNQVMHNKNDLQNLLKSTDRNPQSDSNIVTPASLNSTAEPTPPHVVPSADNVSALQIGDVSEPKHRSMGVTSLIFESAQGQNVLRDRSHIPKDSLGSDPGGPSKVLSAHPKFSSLKPIKTNLAAQPKALSEPAEGPGMVKKNFSKFWSTSEHTTTKTKQHLNFLAKFGRENGEGARGRRINLPHIDARLSLSEGAMKTDTFFSAVEQAADGIDSASSICPDSVDSAVPLPSSDSEFADEMSSIELNTKSAAFIGEEGLFEDLFADPANSRATGDALTLGQAAQAEVEGWRGAKPFERRKNSSDFFDIHLRMFIVVHHHAYNLRYIKENDQTEAT